MTEQLHIYIRVSSDIQVDGTSLEEQERFGRECAERHGWEPVIYNEGSHTSNQDDPFLRPKMRELFTFVESGKVKNLFVWHLDRLSRNGISKAHLQIRLQKAQVKVFTAMGEYDFSNPQDELMYSVVSATATFENKLRAMRTRVGKVVRLKEGKIWKGGPPPFGYATSAKRLVENPDESKWVEYIFKQYLDGKSVEDIKMLLIKNKVLTRRGNAIWSGASVNAILHGMVYRGYFTYTDKDPYTKEIIEVIKVPVEPVISPELVVEVDEALARRERKRVVRPHAKLTHLLRDFLVCETCNQLMSPRVDQKRRIQVYYCPTNERNYRRKGMPTEKPKCSLGSLNITETDNFVWNKFLDVLEKSHYFKSIVKDSVLGKEKTYADHAADIANAKKRLGYNQSKLTKERTLLQMLDAEDLDHKSVILKHQALVAELEEKITDDQLYIAHHDEDKVWVDWIAKFGQTIEGYRGIQTSGDRLPILQKFLHKIEVTKTDTQSKTLRFYFNFGYVNDSYEKETSSVKEGMKTLELNVKDHYLKGAIGRKKQKC